MRAKTTRGAGGLSAMLALALLAASPAAGQEDVGPATEERNRELAERFTDEVYNQRLLDRIPEYVAAEFVDRSPGSPQGAVGPGFVRQQAEASFRSFPDLTFSVEQTIAEGDLVVLRWRATGTASAAVAAAAAGRPVELEGVSIFRFDEEGRIVESWDLTDRQGLLTQLGYRMLAPGPPAVEEPGADEPAAPEGDPELAPPPSADPPAS